MLRVLQGAELQDAPAEVDAADLTGGGGGGGHTPTPAEPTGRCFGAGGGLTSEGRISGGT